MKYAPYPYYKASGIEWLGDVPEAWEVKRLKTLSLIKRGASPRPIENPIYFDDEGEFAWVRISDVTTSKKYLYETEQKLSNLGQSLSVCLNPPSLIVSIAATVGKPIITKIPCCIHDGFICFQNLKANIDFLYYIFISEQPYKGLGKLGTQLNLNSDTVGNIVIPVPPLPEQHAIATFLDQETAKIDALIAKQEQMIALLREKRQAVISHAVTKGLDPTAPMKPSGVEWLGDVPEGWSVGRVQHNTNMKFSNVDKLTVEGEVSVLLCNYVNVYKNDYINSQLDFMQASATLAEIQDFRLQLGDVIITKDSESPDDIAIPAYVIETVPNLICGYHLAVLRARPKKCEGKYLFYFFMSKLCRQQFENQANGITRFGLSQRAIAKGWFIVPSLPEQHAIAAYLDRETTKIDALIAKQEQLITLLGEHRAALITAAVTGKIDVRRAVPSTTATTEGALTNVR